MMVRVRARITVCHAMSGAGSQRQTPISLLLGQAPAGQELVIFFSLRDYLWACATGLGTCDAAELHLHASWVELHVREHCRHAGVSHLSDFKSCTWTYARRTAS